MMRSAGSPWKGAGRRLLSSEISGVRGSRVRPGVARASLTHWPQGDVRRMRPLASSIPNSHTEMTESSKFPWAAARSMALRMGAVNCSLAPVWSQIQ